jgi:hypothetical protein
MADSLSYRYHLLLLFFALLTIDVHAAFKKHFLPSLSVKLNNDAANSLFDIHTSVLNISYADSNHDSVYLIQDLLNNALIEDINHHLFSIIATHISSN